MQLLSADVKLFLKELKKKIWPQKIEKTTPKSCSEILNFFSALYCQTAQEEEFRFQNVA